MSRSVSKISQSLYEIYLHFKTENIDDEYYDDWQDFRDRITETIQNKYNSLQIPSKIEVDGREVEIILKNNHCQIGLSEYNDIVCISIRINETSEWCDYEFAKHWIQQIKKGLKKEIQKAFPDNLLQRVGGFSDGSSIYEKAI